MNENKEKLDEFSSGIEIDAMDLIKQIENDNFFLECIKNATFHSTIHDKDLKD